MLIRDDKKWRCHLEKTCAKRRCASSTHAEGKRTGKVRLVGSLFNKSTLVYGTRPVCECIRAVSFATRAWLKTTSPSSPFSEASLVRSSRTRDGNLSLMSFSPAQIPGSIPAFYREVHEKICSPTSGNVEREVFKSLLVKSQLSSSVLSQVRRTPRVSNLTSVSVGHGSIETVDKSIIKINQSTYTWKSRITLGRLR